MAVTCEQTIILRAGTNAEFTQLLAKANAWLALAPEVVQSVTGSQAQRRVTIITKAYPFEFVLGT